MKTVTRAVAASVLLLATARVCGAWSGPGHQAVCEIAILELAKSNPDVKKKVTKLLSKDSDDNKPFATSCTWADDDAQKDARREDHYVNVPRSTEKITNSDCTGRCLFKAIDEDLEKLKDSTGKQQLEALKYLGHWIGDLHQPLHISYADDRGGNYVRVTQAPNGCTDLHATWDRCIVEEVRLDVGATTGATSLGKKLQAKITDEERAKWRLGTVTEWAEESYAIAINPSTKYCEMEEASCCYDSTWATCEYTGGSKKSDQTKRLKPLPSGYEDGEVETAKEQMQKAGVRLAKMLEEQLQ